MATHSPAATLRHCFLRLAAPHTGPRVGATHNFLPFGEIFHTLLFFIILSFRKKATGRPDAAPHGAPLWSAALGALLLGTTPRLVQADVIYSPAVEAGERALEWRSTVSAGGVEDHKLALEYAPTAWWRAELLATAQRPPGGPRQATTWALENIFSLNPQGRDFLDLGVLAELSRGLRAERGYAVELGVLAEHATRHTVTTVNVGVERALLAGAEAALGLSARWRWRLSPRFEPGVEYHADLGALDHLGALRTQRHALGPALLGQRSVGRGRLHYEAAWVFGLTHGAPASTVRLQLEWEFGSADDGDEE